MSRHLFTIGSFCISIWSYSQTPELDIHKNKLSDFLKIENDLKSERLENNATYVTPNGVAQPILFKRKQTNLPDLIISYFYFQKDSSITHLLYEWHDKTVNGQNPKKTSKEITSFIDKYNELYYQIFKTFGGSKSKGDLNDLSKIETGDFEKTDTWKPNDSTDIELYIILSSRYEKKGNTTINPTYLIRLDIRNRTNVPEIFAKPDEIKIKMLDLVLKTFLKNLQNKDFNKAKLNLSDLIINDVTNDQLETLRQNINFNDELIIFISGVQMGVDGSSYIMLQYKYKSDNSMPPKELINVTFDEKNKIAGLQPTKRS